MNGENRPSRKFRPLRQKRLELKRYSYVYKFLRLGLAQGAISVLPSGGLSTFLTIFRKIYQNSTFAQGIVSTHFDPKIQFQVVWGAPNPNFALQIGGKRKHFWGDLLMGDGRPSGGLPSLKIWERSDKKWGRN